MTPDDVDQLLGARLRRFRRLKGLTQSELGAAVGIRFQQVQKYECAANRMSASRVVQFARVLDIPVGQLFEGLS